MTSVRIRLSEWKELKGAWGDALAAGGRFNVVASSGGVSVWDGERRLRTVDARAAHGVGAPRLIHGLVHFGTGHERAPGEFHALDLPPVPGSPRHAAWSADGKRVAVLWTHGDAGCILELGVDGAVMQEVWRGTPAPAAVWIGAGAIVGIGAQLQAWTASGARRADAHPGGIAALSATHDEARLFTVGWEGRAIVWDTQTWSSRVDLRGDWVGGAIAPDGRYIVLLGRDGVLHAACIDGESAPPLDALAVDDTLVAVALGEGRILGSFRAPSRVSMAQIEVE